MGPKSLALVGTLLEVLGTFFLAVEAIKLQNLRLFRERFLLALYRRINPKVEVVTPSTPRRGRRRGPLDWIEWSFLGLLTIGLVVVCLYVLVILRLAPGQMWPRFAALVPGPWWLDVAAAVPAALLLVYVCLIVGLCIYTLMVVCFGGPILLLEAVEKHTASGIIGITGFTLFLLGAAIHAYLDWVGH